MKLKKHSVLLGSAVFVVLTLGLFWSVLIAQAAPVISLLSPTQGSVVMGKTVLVVANYTDTSNITGPSSEFLWVDGAQVNAPIKMSQPTVIVGRIWTARFTATWDSTTVPNGQHSLFMKFNTGSSATVTVTVNNAIVPIPPTIAFTTAPQNNSTISGQVTISATAQGQSPISYVDFSLNGTLINRSFNYPVSNQFSFSLDTTAYQNGGYMLTAIAVDQNGLSSTAAQVNFSINNAVGGGTSNAWQEPAAAFPNGGPSAPLDTSSVGQLKTGAIDLDTGSNPALRILNGSICLKQNVGYGISCKLYWDQISPWTLGQSSPAGFQDIYYNSGGAVGIGTVTPKGNFNIVSNVDQHSYFDAAGNYSEIHFSTAGGSASLGIINPNAFSIQNSSANGSIVIMPNGTGSISLFGGVTLAPQVANPPACNASTQGMLWFDKGNTGSHTDTLEICGDFPAISGGGFGGGTPAGFRWRAL